MQLQSLAKSTEVLNKITSTLNNTELSSIAVKKELEAIGKSYTTETLKAAIAQSTLNKEQIKAILTANGLQGELLETTVDELANAASINTVAASQTATTATTLGLSTAFKGLGIQIKNTTTAMLTWLATNPIGWIAAVGAAIYGAVKLYDALTVSLEEQKEKLRESKEAYENVKNELQEIENELQSNKDAIKELEALPNLTWVEQEELDKLRKVTKELELQKKLKQEEQLRAAEDLYQENLKTFNKEFGSSLDIATVDGFKQLLSSGKISAIQLDLENNLVDIEAMLQYLSEEKEQLTDESEIQSYEQMIADLMQTKNDLIKNKGQEALSSLSEYKQNILDIASVRDLTEEEQATYDYFTSLQKMIYEFYSPATWNSIEFDSIFDTKGLEKTKEELIAMAKAGELSPETLQAFPKLSAAIKDSELIVKEGSDAFTEFYNELVALAGKQEEIVSNANENLVSPPTLSSSISTLATQLEPQFSELGDLYNEIFQTDDDGNDIFSLDSVDNAALESIRKSFAKIGEEIGVTFDAEQLEPFFDTLTNGSSTADDVQQAFNDLATAYLYSTDTLEQLNDETAVAVKKQLEQMGVTNAEEIVAEALRVKNEELALSKKYLALEGKELAEATDSEVLAFMAEQTEAGNCSTALAALQLKKLLVNGTLLDTEADIQNVMNLAQSAGIATESLAELITLKAAYEKAEADGRTNTMAFSMLADRMKALKQDFQNDVNNFELDPVGIKFEMPNESSKSSASSSATKQAETDWKNVLDKETDLLEKQLAANVITFKEYTDKRRQIIEGYYRDGKIKAEDYYDAIESMYDSHLSLYDRVIGAVTGRIDEEIDRLNDQKEAIENFYQVRIDSLQTEIDALNAANDARREQIDLENAQYEAERARNQHVNKIYDGSQFIYEADMDSVRDAEEDLADKEIQLNISRLETQIESLEEEMENATKSLDNQIDALEAYKDKWNEISDIYQKQQDKLLAAEVMGTEWERDILNGRLDTLRSFTEQYIALQQAQADAAVNAAKIKAEAEAGNATGGNVRSVNTDSNDNNVNKDGNGSLLGQAFETIANTVTEGIARTTKTFLTSIKETQIPVKKSRGIAGDDLYYVKKYASGTEHARKGLNLVGEEGTETFIDNDGNISLVTKPTLIPMEGGEVVKNVEETKALLNADNIAEPEQSEKMKALFEHIRNLQPSDFNWQNIMKPMSFFVNLPSMNYSHMLNNANPDPTPVVQNITLTLPNVTNNSGADYIMRELKRLPLDTIQYMHKRR